MKYFVDSFLLKRTIQLIIKKNEENSYGFKRDTFKDLKNTVAKFVKIPY